jgi:hypothetical protein
MFQLSGSTKRPIWVAPELSRKQDNIGPLRANDAVCLNGSLDKTNGTNRYARFPPNFSAN